MPSPRDSLKNRKPARRPKPIPPMHLLHPAPPLSKRIMDSAKTTIAKRLGTDPSQDQSIYEMLERMQHYRVQQTKITREEHLARIMEAYASYVYFSRHPEFDQFIAGLAKELGITLSKKTHPLRVIVQSCIWYGENKGNNRSASKLYSRDVQAILHLIKEEIPPTEGVYLAQTPKNGLDAWARVKNIKATEGEANEQLLPSTKHSEKGADISAGFEDSNSLRETEDNINAKIVQIRSRVSATIDILTETEKYIVCEFIVLANSRYRAGTQSPWSSEDLEIWSRILEFFENPPGYADSGRGERTAIFK